MHSQVERQTSDMFEKMQGQLSHLESELNHSRAMREKEGRERARERREERERAEREKEALKRQHEEQVEEMVREHQSERERLQRNLEEKRVRNRQCKHTEFWCVLRVLQYRLLLYKGFA